MSLFHCKIRSLRIQSQPAGSLSLTVPVSKHGFARIGLVRSRTVHTQGGIESLCHLASLHTAIANKVKQRMPRVACRALLAKPCFLTGSLLDELGIFHPLE